MKNTPHHFLVFFLMLNLIACQQGYNVTERGRHQSVVYDDKIWIIGGQGGPGNPIRSDVYYSADGLIWNEATTRSKFGARANHTVIVFENKMWLIGGATNNSPGSATNDVYYSDDGINWYAATRDANFGPRDAHTALVYDDKIWVIGGSGGTYTELTKKYNDVYYSSNGVDWSLVITNAAFSPRQGHASVIYDNKMWVIGGYDTNGPKNDVYYSSDGLNWVAATLNAAFSPRHYHTALVYDGKMWVVGGLSDQKAKNDVYYSTNGVDWFVATSNATFSPRFVHTAVTYDNKMWIIGGGFNDEDGNDVYNSSDGITWTQITP